MSGFKQGPAWGLSTHEASADMTSNVGKSCKQDTNGEIALCPVAGGVLANYLGSIQKVDKSGASGAQYDVVQVARQGIWPVKSGVAITLNEPITVNASSLYILQTGDTEVVVGWSRAAVAAANRIFAMEHVLPHTLDFSQVT